MITYVVYLSTLYTALTFLVAYWADRHPDPQIDTRTALDLGLLLMIFGFAGARLMHVFYENPEYYAQDPWRIFQVWQGGFVFYGGAVAGYGAGLLYVKIKKLDWKIWSDFYAPVIALGYGLGRFSCFLAGCCYGATCDFPWAVSGRHPTQLYALLWELLNFMNLRRLQKATKPRPAGQIFFIWLATHAVGRLIMESFRDDFRGSIIFGLTISSVISLVLLILAVGGLFTVSARQKPE